MAAASVLAALAAVLATAAPLPAQRFPLGRIGGEPLLEGFAEVIHPNGPQVYARHVYQVNGARSNETYAVTISIWTTSLACAGSPTFVLPAAELSTNGSGNGRADVAFGPEPIAALGLRGLTIGGDITLLRDGSPAYATGCRVVRLD
jgi:hypothetical protein